MHIKDRRVHYQRLIERQQDSHQPVIPFCREQGISEATFYLWRKRLRLSPTRGVKPVARTFIPLALPISPGAEAAIVLELPGSITIRVGPEVTPSHLRSVIAVLLESQ